ncbi:MAG: pectate lyase [Planctomycetota bacterium]
MKKHLFQLWLPLLVALLAVRPCAAEDLHGDARKAMQRAVEFYSTKVATHGGYVYRYSDDLAKREGEGKTDLDTLWVQPPGTPAVGMAFVEAYELTREPSLLEAAHAAADCLIHGQYRSGGWNASVEFAPAERKKTAYRVDPPIKKSKATPFNVTSYDDDKSQSAMRFLMRLDQATNFKDGRLHEAITFALDSTLKAQYPNGAWPQGYAEFPDPEKYPVKQASFPETWSRTMTAKYYHQFYTLNDNSLADVIDVMFLASEIYGDAKYRRAAERAGDFLILAQLPEPQPAWAQQYDFEMHPCWARKFEPPAVSGLESQGAIRALMQIYTATGDRKYLKPILPAIDYLKRSRLSDGRLARFYELHTNKPLYFTKEYVLTHDDGDVPTHYGFKVDAKLDELSQEYEKLAALDSAGLEALRHPKPKKPGKLSPSLEAETRKVITALDARGAWIEDGTLKYHGKGDDTRRVITSETFIKNLRTLSRYLARTAG